MTFLPDITGRKVLITGATGFIGSSLCRHLCATEAEINAIYRTTHPSIDKRLRWHQVDLEEAQAVEQLLATLRPELIFHLAGYVTAARDLSLVVPTLYGCLITTVNLLKAAATTQSCRRIILAGSAEEGDQNPGAIPTSPYAAAKSAATSYGRMFHQLYDLPVVIVRPFMTFGPGQSQQKLIPYVITCLLGNKAPSLTSGYRAIDWIYVDDVVDGLLATATIPGIEGKTIDLGTGRATSIQRVVELISKLMGSEIEPIYGALPDRPLERSLVADIAYTRAVLGWEPKTSLEQGLCQTIEWYKDYLRNNNE